MSINEKKEEKATKMPWHESASVATSGAKTETRKYVGPSRDEKWRDVLQFLKEQIIKMEKFSRTLRVI